MLAAQETIKGNTAALSRSNRIYKKAEEEYIKAANFPISEYIAMEFIQTTMDCEFRRKQSVETSPVVKKTRHEQNEIFNAILFDKGVFGDIVNGLRFHIFTPRSFATLIEAVFAFEG